MDTTTKRGPGRPLRSSEAGKPRAVRMTDAEWELVKDAAARSGQTAGDYIRGLVLVAAEASEAAASRPPER